MADVADSIRASTLPKPVDFDDPRNPARHGGRFVTGIVDSLSDAIGNFASNARGVYRGEVDPLAEDSIEKSFELASNLAGMGTAKAAVSKPTPGEVELGIFAGPKSKTADIDALKYAIEMHSDRPRVDVNNAYRQQILEETGWFKGLDGKWRYEIDDSAIGMPLGPLPAKMEGYLGNELQHPELFAAYPGLRETRIATDLPVGNGSSSSPSGFYPEGKISIPSKEYPGMEGQPLAQNNPLSVLMHEIQHQIQAREGFSGGSSPGYVQQRIIEELQKPGVPTNPDLVRAFNAMPQEQKAGMLRSLYRHNPGEVEAAQVQGRLPLTAIQRREWHPIDDLPANIDRDKIYIPFKDINER